MAARAHAIASGIGESWRRLRRLAGRHRFIAWTTAAAAAACGTGVIVPVILIALHIYRDRANLPDPGPFERFEFLAIGHVYDANGAPLIQLAREHRAITRYEDIPRVVRDAIVATEDKHFFTHNGVD